MRSTNTFPWSFLAIALLPGPRLVQAQTTFAENLISVKNWFVEGSTVTPDGGLVVCGTGYGATTYDRGFLLRTDAVGNVLWSREYTSFGYFDLTDTNPPFHLRENKFNDVRILPDSTILVCGTTGASAYGRPMVARFAGNGDTLSCKAYDGAYNFGNKAVALEATGTALCAGDWILPGDATIWAEVQRINPVTLQRLSRFRLVGRANDVQPTPDGGCVLTGVFRTGPTISDPFGGFIARLDPDLNEYWTQGFAWPSLAEITDTRVELAADSSYYMAAVGEEDDVMLLNMAPSGAVNWLKRIVVPGAWESITDLHVLPNGKLVFAFGNSTTSVILRLDSGGQVEWARSFPLPSPTAVEPCPDGGYFVIGRSLPSATRIVKLDSLGQSASCPTTAIAPVVSVGPALVQMGPIGNQWAMPPPHPYQAHVNQYDTAVYVLNDQVCSADLTQNTASGLVFADADTDGIRDPGELPLPSWAVGVTPNMGWVLANGSGEFTFSSYFPTTFTLTPALSPWWYLTTDSATYQAAFSPTDSVFTDLDFGFAPILDTTVVDVWLPSEVNSPGCAGSSLIQLHASNMGSTRPSGVIAWQMDSIMQLVGAVPPPDSMVGQTIFWYYDTLAYFTAWSAQVEFNSPGTSGDTLATSLAAYADDGLGGLVLLDSIAQATIVVCAFDPNNKEVAQPAFIPVDQDWLTYTINFQNTGTDTAYTVRIEDQLSQHLQWNTLQYLGSSHDLTGLSIGPLGKAEFTFSNVQLPDSNVNEPASHGFVTYRIAPQVGIPHLTPIENNAGIFFDLNAPVITNTTANRVINCATADPWPIWVVNFGNDLYAGTHINDTLSYTYQWYLNGLPIAGATGTLNVGGQAWWSANASGDYNIELVDQFGCNSSSAPFTHVLLNVPAYPGSSFAVVPNPMHHSAQLVSNGAFGADTVFELVDVHGRVVRSLRGNGTREVLIERGALQCGLYMVRVLRNGEHMASTRLVVQ